MQTERPDRMTLPEALADRKMNAGDIEIALSRLFNPRQNIIVPNVSWGWFLDYEADLIIVTQSGYATEIEIKVSRSDIKADKAKDPCAHNNKKIKRFFYAVPEEIADDPNLPEDCGLISIKNQDGWLRCKTIRPPKINKFAEPLTEKQIKKLMHLGCMRIWSLKESLRDVKRRKGRVRPPIIPQAYRR